VFSVPKVNKELFKSEGNVYHNSLLPFVESPKHLLKIKQMSPGGWTVSDFCVNERGNMIAVVCLDQLIVYVLDDEHPGKIAMKNDCSQLIKQHFSHGLCFVGDFLCCISRDGKLLYLIQPVTMNVAQIVDLTIQDDADKSNSSSLFSNQAVHYVTSVSDKYVMVARGNFVVAYKLNVDNKGATSMTRAYLLDQSSLNSIPYRIVDLGDNLFSVLSAGSANYIRIYNAEKQILVGSKRITHDNFVDHTYSLEGGVRGIMRNKNKGEDEYVLMTHKELVEMKINTTKFDTNNPGNVKKLDSRKFTSKLDVFSISEDEAIVLKHVWDDFMLKLPDVFKRSRFGV